MTVQVTASEILKAAEDKEASLPTVHIADRSLEQEQDLGNLLGWDENELDYKIITDYGHTNREEYLTKLARDNTQVLNSGIESHIICM
jgi:hypothetical protein